MTQYLIERKDGQREEAILLEKGYFIMDLRGYRLFHCTVGPMLQVEIGHMCMYFDVFCAKSRLSSTAQVFQFPISTNYKLRDMM